MSTWKGRLMLSLNRSELRQLYDEDEEPKSYPTPVESADKVLVLVCESGGEIQARRFLGDMPPPSTRFVFLKVSVTLAESLFGR